jgi:hypothetical protein
VNLLEIDKPVSDFSDSAESKPDFMDNQSDWVWQWNCWGK